MKVLLINYTDAGGGAAIAAFRITEALYNAGVNITMGVIQKKSEAPFVIEIPRKRKTTIAKTIIQLSKIIKKIYTRVLFPLSSLTKFRTTNNILHSINNSSIVDINWINNFDCDVVNLHWVGSDMLSIKDISRINKPIVWTMHDSWPCCGAEHYQNILENDTRWKEGYFRSNKPKTTKGIDICRHVWCQKKKYLVNKKIHFVAPSNWQHDILCSSALFNQNLCSVVPNIIPKKLFFKRDKDYLRSLFGISVKTKIIGFGAAENLNDKNGRKGSYYLSKALKKLSHSGDYFLVVFGPQSNDFITQIEIPHFISGYIENPLFLSFLYNICDVIVCPSLIENLPNICLEALFCGVPSVAFDVGGISDIVVHKKNGWLATPYNEDELAEGIEWCSEHKEELSQNCLEKAKNDFDANKIIHDYISVYSDAINESFK